MPIFHFNCVALGEVFDLNSSMGEHFNNIKKIVHLDQSFLQR